MATGCLSIAKLSEYPGLKTFQGRWYHTGHWPHERVDFTGQRVAGIGTGSSGIQSVPRIAARPRRFSSFNGPQFQHAGLNRPLEPEIAADWKENRGEYQRQPQASPKYPIRPQRWNAWKRLLDWKLSFPPCARECCFSGC
jgi:cation diffusion facilitator CzcD-associated flavoprotein CzcO